MPTCRYCLGTFSREQFIHGNGPRAQVCIRCAVEMKIATEEEILMSMVADEALYAGLKKLRRMD